MARMKLEERFWSKVKKTDGCWYWMAATGRNGRYSIKFLEGEALSKALAFFSKKLRIDESAAIREGGEG